MHFALALVVAAATVSTVKLTESGGAKVGMAAPSFGGWDLTGKKVLTLDGLRRKPQLAPLLITFGASWCTACAVGLPRLHSLSVKHPEIRLVLVDVEMDSAKAQAFAAKYQVDSLALLDKFEQVARTYGVAGDEKTSLPRTFLLDTQGKVRAIYREEGADLEQVIEADLEAAKTPIRPQ
jgi:peroxiredoxin